MYKCSECGGTCITEDSISDQIIRCTNCGRTKVKKSQKIQTEDMNDITKDFDTVLFD